MLAEFTFAGAGRQIDARGTFFRYESGTSGTGVAGVAIYADGQNIGTFLPGDSIELPAAVGRWELRPVESDCAGRVRIGFGRVESTRLVGVVQTVDGGRARSISGVARVGQGWLDGVAGQYNYIQLWNTSTTHRGIVTAVVVGSGGETQAPVIRYSGVALDVPTADAGGGDKMGNEGWGACEVRTRRSTGHAVGTLGTGTTRVSLFNPATSVVQYRPTEPFVIPPGRGLVVGGMYAGKEMGVSFEWFEEAL